jgi:6-phosphogluconolactonase
MTPYKIFSDLRASSKFLADQFNLLAQAAVIERGYFTAVLSGGGTPQLLYELLAETPYSGTIPWENVHLFWGDERAVPPTTEGSSYRQAYETFIQHVPIPPKNVWRVKGEMSPEAAAVDYASQLKKFVNQYQPTSNLAFPIFDFVLMGMGSDGHTASLFPHSPLATEPVIPVVAHYEDRPAKRVSLTEMVFGKCRHLYFLVAGESKADMIQTVFTQAPDPIARPAQRIQLESGELLWVLDKAAAKKITF